MLPAPSGCGGRRFMKPTLLVLAAGMGSRYGGLKQLDPMGPHGETVLDYSVYDALLAGFGRVVFVIREEFAGAFREGIGARFAGRIEVGYAFQRPDDLPSGFSAPEGRVKPWGTAHAVRAARDEVDGPFAVINADDFYGRDAYRRAAAFLASCGDGSRMALVGYPLGNTLSEHGKVNRGICRFDAAGGLESVAEFLEIGTDEDGVLRGTGPDGTRSVLDAAAPVSMNLWAFPHAFFSQMEDAFVRFLREIPDPLKSECYIPTVVDDLIRSGVSRCEVLTTTSRWFGMTYPGDKPFVVESVRALIESGEYPSPLVCAP